MMEYSDFGSMLRHQGVRACLPHLKDDNFTAALRVYHSFPDYKTKAKHYGVVAFKLAPLNRTSVIQSSFNLPHLFLQAMVAEVDRVESMQNRSNLQSPSVAYHDGDNNDSCNERDPTLITTPKTTGAASAPNQLIKKVAQRIVNGEGYQTACEALDFNLNKDKEYMGHKTSDYMRLQHQVRKLKDEQRKVSAKWNNDCLVEHLKSVTYHLNSVLEQNRVLQEQNRVLQEQNRVLQEKLDKCVCGGSRKRKITYSPSSGKKTKSKNDPDIGYCY